LAARHAVWPLALAILILHCFSTGTRAGEPAPTPPATPPNTSAAPGGFIGQALQVSNAPAAEIRKVLEPLITQGGAVLDQPGGKSLMIVDTPESFRRLSSIKDLLDVPAFANARFNVYQPRGESADELAREINELQRNLVLRSPLSGSFAVPLPVGNVLLVISTKQEAWNNARTWLQKIDRPGSLPRQIYIYPLESKEAEQAAQAAIAALPKPTGNRASAPAGRDFQVTFDAPTRTLIVHATPAEFQELKNRLNPDATFAEFKQRVAAIAQEFSPEPPVAATPKPANTSAF
jgi:type II secretory pathway component GspD/PulD (secretin)